MTAGRHTPTAGISLLLRESAAVRLEATVRHSLSDLFSAADTFEAERLAIKALAESMRTPAQKRGAMLELLAAAFASRRAQPGRRLEATAHKLAPSSGPETAGRQPDPGPPIPRADLCRLALAAPNAPNWRARAFAA